jgi:hypothetical protein
MNDLHYLRAGGGIPRKFAKGRVLVHNHVFLQRVLGANGFRAWIQTLDDTIEVCHCDWAGVDLGGLLHYRIKRVPIQKAEKGTVKGSGS